MSIQIGKEVDNYLSVELSHCGTGANPDINIDQVLSPSGIPIGIPFTSTNPKAMTREDMDFVRDRWVECSRDVSVPDLI